jgi:TonB family protein
MLHALALVVIAASTSGRCPPTQLRPAQQPQITAPEGARATHARVRIAVDVGSDGRVRRAEMAESSGDPALDRALLSAVQSTRYEPSSVSCVAFSSSALETYTLPADQVATPAPGTTPAAVAVCDAPFVTPSGFSVGPHPSHGTAVVDVHLDAAAHVDAVRIVQSSGNANAVADAVAAARASGYAFQPFAGCPPAETTYRMEITFR